MRKNLCFALAVTAALASCQRDVELRAIPESQEPQGMAVSFDAYLKNAVTKGTVENTATLHSQTSGVGIYAFYQAAVSGSKTLFNTRKFATPDFMYNQKLGFDSTNTVMAWTYTPVKFWPNNSGDLLSFFAYAPYDSDQTWDDMDVATDAVASKLTVGFTIADEVSSQKDILWARPLINQTNKDANNVNQLSNSLMFSFEHMTSKIDLLVGVDNGANLSNRRAWTDANTDIIIKNIVFSGLYGSYDYVYTITDGALAASGTCDYSKSSTFDLTVAPCAAADTISNGWNPTDGYQKYLDANEYMFIAPQTFSDETVAITYTVKTTDTNAANSSEITNVITKDIKDIIAKTESGKAYNLKFLIGIDDVNISATVADWATATEYQNNVPANN